MKYKIPIEDRTITVPVAFMDFAKNRCREMLYANNYISINDMLAQAYLLACNDMVQITDLIKESV